MIIDTLENLEKYVAVNPRLQVVADYVKSVDLEKLENGKHQIMGDDVFVNVQTLKGKQRETAPFEYHRQMVDVQIPLSGSETYGYKPVVDLPAAPFDEANDCALIHGEEATCFVTCRKGMFVIFFPEDGHAPGITDASELHKLIFKVRV